VPQGLEASTSRWGSIAQRAKRCATLTPLVTRLSARGGKRAVSVRGRGMRCSSGPSVLEPFCSSEPWREHPGNFWDLPCEPSALARRHLWLDKWSADPSAESPFKSASGTRSFTPIALTMFNVSLVFCRWISVDVLPRVSGESKNRSIRRRRGRRSVGYALRSGSPGAPAFLG
jgi:hypothetical protein